MNVIFDASALLNLANGGVLETVLDLPNLIGWIGPQVRGECASIAARLDALIGSQSIQLLDDETLPASLFISLLGHYRLGPGETECLAFASQGDHVVCCNDRRARSMITRELGSGRVTGTIGLLALGVHHEKLTIEAALGACEQMRRRGGFLPELSPDDLDRAVASLKSSESE